MACFSPLRAYQTDGGEIIFAERGQIKRELVLPCGQCVGCLLERSRQWAMRCMHEAQLWPSNAFVTLTYDDEHLPENSSLKYRDFQLFMKRLRKTGRKVRFFMCGEYGETFARPHFHACLFNCHFDDLRPYRRLPSGSLIGTSETLEALWPNGFSSVGDVTFESAAYVARYTIKKFMVPEVERLGTVDMSTGELTLREKEFVHMSLKPGIGFEWFRKFRSDVFEHDYVIVNGLKVKPPKYYDRLLTVLDPESKEFVDLERYRKSFDFEDDARSDRLRARETVTRARLSFKSRRLE